MSPIDSQGRWYNPPARASAADLASASRAIGTATSPVFDVGAARDLLATLNVTLPNGGSATVGLDVTYDGTNWEDAGAWPAKTAAGTHRRRFSVAGASSARWRWTVATAAVTFQIDNVEATGR